MRELPSEVAELGVSRDDAKPFLPCECLLAIIVPARVELAFVFVAILLWRLVRFMHPGVAR